MTAPQTPAQTPTATVVQRAAAIEAALAQRGLQPAEHI